MAFIVSTSTGIIIVLFRVVKLFFAFGSSSCGLREEFIVFWTEMLLEFADILW